MKPIDYHLDARREANDAAAYYHGEDPEVSIRFLDALERIASEIQSAPQRWPFERGTDAQRRPIKGFPYIVFYLNETRKIVILAAARAIGRSVSRLINRPLSSIRERQSRALTKFQHSGGHH